MTTKERKFRFPKLTGCVVSTEAKEEKTEGVRTRTRLNGVRRVDSDAKGSAGNICPHCQRVFPKPVGLSLHITRWCKKVPDGAGGSIPPMGGSIPPMAEQASGHDQAQNHKSCWNFALTHLDSKQPSAVLNSYRTRSHLKLPNASNRRKWKELDSSIETAIVTGMSTTELRHGKVDDVLRRFTDIVYDTAAKVCGTADSKRAKKKGCESKRQPAMLHRLKALKRDARCELRRTKRRGGDVLSAHKLFMRAVRAHHDLVNMISANKKLKSDVIERRRFLHDPHMYAKRLLNPPITGKPTFSKEVADVYFKDTYRDSNRSFAYVPMADFPRPPQPTHAFDEDFASFDEFTDICRSRSNGSAPGLNGIPYLVYKRCTEVRRLLWKILSRVWKDRAIPNIFQVGRIRLLPKSGDTSHPNLMRPISVLNAEGRLFWTVFQRRLSKYMLGNGYIDRKTQKAFWRALLVVWSTRRCSGKC